MNSWEAWLFIRRRRGSTCRCSRQKRFLSLSRKCGHPSWLMDIEICARWSFLCPGSLQVLPFLQEIRQKALVTCWSTIDIHWYTTCFNDHFYPLTFPWSSWCHISCKCCLFTILLTFQGWDLQSLHHQPSIWFWDRELTVLSERAVHGCI